MVSLHAQTCDRRQPDYPIDFYVNRPDAWCTVVLNRCWKLCPGPFDSLAQTGIRCQFTRDVPERQVRAAER